MKTIYKVIIFTIFYFIMVFSFGSENSDLLTVFLTLSLMIPIVYLISDRYTQKNKIASLQEESLRAELNLLKSQINPHFFFNTLNNLYGLAVEKSDKTKDVIYKLSEMMRFTIYDGRKDTVTVKEEIHYLKNFIELNQLRYNESIDIKFDEDIENDQQRIPPLLFINLLENGFKHGAESGVENAYIHVKLSCNSKKINFTISNNFDSKTSSEKVGIGLENLKRRLSLLFPNKHIYRVIDEHGIYKTEVKIDLT